MATPLLDLADLQTLAYGVGQTLPRVAATLAVIPFLSGQLLSGLARGGITLMLAIWLAPTSGPVIDGGLAQWLGLMLKEALIGLMLGLGYGLIVWAVQSVGDLIDLQTGASNVEFYDPVAGREGAATGQFLGWLVITLFVTSGGLLMLIASLADSYRLWPVASFVPRLDEVLELFAIRQGDTLLQWTVKLAAPVVGALALADLGIGLVGRVAPQLDLMALAQPIKSVLAALMLLLVLFFLYESLEAFLAPDNGVIAFLRQAL